MDLTNAGLVVSAIILYFAQTSWHEGSHALVGLLQGDKILDWSIRPKYRDHDNNPETRELMFFGYVTFDDPPDNPPERFLRSIAPMLSAFLPLGLGMYFHDDVAWAALWLPPTIDLTRGWAQPIWTAQRGDVNKALRALGISHTVRAITGSLVATLVVAAAILRWFL